MSNERRATDSLRDLADFVEEQYLIDSMPAPYELVVTYVDNVEDPYVAVEIAGNAVSDIFISPDALNEFDERELSTLITSTLFGAFEAYRQEASSLASSD